MLIIHKVAPQLPYFPVIVEDWRHEDGLSYGVTLPPVGSGANLWTLPPPIGDFVDTTINTIVIYVSGLINGRGRYNTTQELPLTVFKVTHGQRYRFRVVNAAADFFYQVTIDDHKLTVVAVDGIEVRPIAVYGVILLVAERVDFVVDMDQPVGRYWMRARTLNDVLSGKELQETLAIIEYEGGPDNGDPTTSFMTCTPAVRCVLFNCPFKFYPPIYNTDCVHMQDARHIYTPKEFEQYDLSREEPDETFFINVQTFSGGRGNNFNGINDILRTAPVSQKDHVDVPCDGCPNDNTCDCSHVLSVSYNKIIHLVVSSFNLQTGFNAVGNHPIHLHGHHMAVLKQEFADYTHLAPGNSIKNNRGDDIECDNMFCRNAKWRNGPPTLNFDEPPLKDTVAVSASGYAVLRIRTDNPGPWRMHCHIQHHLVEGRMVLLLEVARDHFPPVPPCFPTCQEEFELSTSTFERFLRDALRQARVGDGFTPVDPKRQAKHQDRGKTGGGGRGDEKPVRAGKWPDFLACMYRPRCR